MTRFSELLVLMGSIVVGQISATLLRFASSLVLVSIIGTALLGADRPRSYFRDDKPTLAASAPVAQLSHKFADSDDPPADATEPEETPQPDPDATPIPMKLRPVPIDDDDWNDPDDDWRRPDHNRGKLHTLTAYLKSAVTIYEDLPDELSDDREFEVKPIRVTGWSPSWCRYCPAAKRRLGNDPRIEIDWKTSECPYPLYQGQPWKYPMITDRDTNYFYDGAYLESVETLLGAIKSDRERKGLPMLEALTTKMPDSEIGEIEHGLAQALAQFDNGDLTGKNSAGTFTLQGFTVGLPAGLQVSVASDRNGTRFDFTGGKPTIRANGFWTVKRTVNSIVVSKDLDRVTLKLNWWRTLSLRVTKR